MRVNSISNTNNTNFAAKRIHNKHINSKNTNHSNDGADSVLLLFAGLLDALGIKGALYKLINNIR